MSFKPTMPLTCSERLRDESGMTIIEVTVAAFLLVTAVVGTFSVIDTSTRTTFRAEESQTVINVAQREMEELRKVPYDQLAMTALPAPPHGTGVNDPTARIRPSNEFCLERVDGDDPCTAHPLVVNGGALEPSGTIADGQVEPLTANVQVGDITVDIYRFVVWQDEGDELLPVGDALCLDKPLHHLCRTQDYKRVIVVVQAHEAAISHERPYEEVQSDFIDPDRATLDAEPLGPGDPPVTGQQFWLSDTPCEAGLGDPNREPPSDHETHDTLGDNCSGNEPDALLTSPPPSAIDPGHPNPYDYSTELEPACPDPPPDPLPASWPIDCVPDDVGLQMLDQDGPCTATPTGADAAQQIHRWVSAPMAEDFRLANRATLELWSRTIDDVQGASGEVCAFLFKRTEALLTTIDTPLASDSYSSTQWPSGSWEEIRFRFDLSSLSLLQRTLLPNERLGIAIGVDPSGTPDNVLQFLYDHPTGESRLEVLTTTPLPLP